MSYEDSFYVKANITGYTGDIDNNPTVYFQKGNRFGRITQDHDNADNIGRNKVREYDDYRHENNSSGKAEEYYNGKVQHTSRNPFVSIGGLTDTDVAKLATAISNFTDIKPKY